MSMDKKDIALTVGIAIAGIAVSYLLYQHSQTTATAASTDDTSTDASATDFPYTYVNGSAIDYNNGSTSGSTSSDTTDSTVSTGDDLASDLALVATLLNGTSGSTSSTSATGSTGQTTTSAPYTGPSIGLAGNPTNLSPNMTDIGSLLTVTPTTGSGTVPSTTGTIPTSIGLAGNPTNVTTSQTNSLITTGDTGGGPSNTITANPVRVVSSVPSLGSISAQVATGFTKLAGATAAS